MKAISINQPFATLIALEAKRIETRHWAAPEKLIGHRIGIYATKGRAKHDDSHPTRPGKEWTLKEEAEFLELEPFNRHLSQLYIHRTPYCPAPGAGIESVLPRGVIVATAVLQRCREMDDEWIEALDQARPDEVDFGLYGHGRYAWILSEVIRTKPIDLTGVKGTRQGIFDVPDELVFAGMEIPGA